jgi:regulatory protein
VDAIQLKAQAIACLSRREYSCAELRRKLKPCADDPQQLDAVLEALQQDGLLSEARFAESVVHRRAARFGGNRIIAELKQHALDDGLVDAIAARLRETELMRAAAIQQKKFHTLPLSFAERIKQSRFLAMRGFTAETITQLFKDQDD